MRGLLALGQHDRAQDLMDRAGGIAAMDPRVRHLVGPLRARVDARRGDLPAAARMLEDLAADAGPAGIGDFFRYWHGIGYAELAFASGDLSLLEEVRILLDHPWLVSTSERTSELILNALRAAVCPLAGQPGSADEAAKWAETADRLYRHGELGTAWSLEVVALRGHIAGTDNSEDWSAAVAAWERIGYRFDEAVCRLRLGEALLREGCCEQAVEQLTSAFSIAEFVEAKPLAEAVRRSARLARLRLKGNASTDEAGPGTLTPRETEVLALVARGRTNEQIGSELYMSPKTASVHVSRIITKVGAANRTEAAALARHLGLLD
jgi:DNA-binding CsgD family transcriptional regulator